MKKLTLLALIIVAVSFCGCGVRRPFEKPEYVEIQNDETGFAIPQEGKVGDQLKFQSEEFLANLQVATKRIQIPHRWSQTGRITFGLFGRNRGEYLDIVKVIKVKRSPETRKWTADSSTGTGSSDEAIWAESKDSIEFSTGFTCTAYIRSEDAAKFLYLYTSGSLAQLMDTEILSRIQAKFSEKSAEYDLSDLREEKQAIVSAIREDVIPFFASRGVTITTIGMFGGLTYKDPEIQVAINDVFKAERDKEIAVAEQTAQEIRNATDIAKAEAAASASINKAQGEAKAVALLNEASEKAASNPVFLSLKDIEVEKLRLEKWNGAYPQWYMGSSNTDMPSVIVTSPMAKN